MLGFDHDVIARDGQEYLRRWMFRCKLFSVRLHHFIGADPDHHHDHPFSFVSLLLRGSYTEEIRFEVETTEDEAKKRIARGFNVSLERSTGRWSYWGTRIVRRVQQMTWAYRHKSTRHRVQAAPEGCWTLVLTGPTWDRSDWGFWVTDHQRIDHAEYAAEQGWTQ